MNRLLIMCCGFMACAAEGPTSVEVAPGFNPGTFTKWQRGSRSARVAAMKGSTRKEQAPERIKTRQAEKEKREIQDATLRTAVHDALEMVPEIRKLDIAHTQIREWLDPASDQHDINLSERYMTAVARLQAQAGHLTAQEQRIVVQALFGQGVDVVLTKDKQLQFMPRNALAEVNKDLDKKIDEVDEVALLRKFASAKQHMGMVRCRYRQSRALYERLCADASVAIPLAIAPLDFGEVSEVAMFDNHLASFLVRICGKVVALPDDSMEGDRYFTLVQDILVRLSPELLESFGVFYHKKHGFGLVPCLSQAALDKSEIGEQATRLLGNLAVIAPVLRWYDDAAGRVVSSVRTHSIPLPSLPASIALTGHQEKQVDLLEELIVDLDSKREALMKESFERLLAADSGLHEIVQRGGAVRDWRVQAQLQKIYNAAATKAREELAPAWDELQTFLSDKAQIEALQSLGCTIQDGGIVLLPAFKKLAGSSADGTLSIADSEQWRDAAEQHHRFMAYKQRTSTLYARFWYTKDFFEGRLPRNYTKLVEIELGEKPNAHGTHLQTPAQLLEHAYGHRMWRRIEASCNGLLGATHSEERLADAAENYVVYATKMNTELYQRYGVCFHRGRMVIMPSRFTVPPLTQTSAAYTEWAQRLQQEYDAFMGAFGVVHPAYRTYRKMWHNAACKAAVVTVVNDTAKEADKKKKRPAGFGGTGWQRDAGDRRAAWDEARRNRGKKDTMKWADNPMNKGALPAKKKEKTGGKVSALRKFFERKPKKAAIPEGATGTVSPLHDNVG